MHSQTEFGNERRYTLGQSYLFWVVYLVQVTYVSDWCSTYFEVTVQIPLCKMGVEEPFSNKTSPNPS